MQLFKKELRESLLEHLKDARNVTTPIDAKEFHWRINWKAQQKYCKSISRALFSNTSRLNLEINPDLALYRPGDPQRGEMVARAFPECRDATRKASPTMTASLLEHYAKTIPTTEIFVSSSHYFVWNMYLDSGDSLFEFMGRPRGAQCPNPEVVLFTKASAPNSRMIPVAIDDELAFLRFGIYGDEVHRAGYSGGRYGRVGQRFVWVTALTENLFQTWAIGKAYHAHEGTTARYHDRHLLACVINFD